MLAIFVFVCAGNVKIIIAYEGKIETMKALVHEPLECLNCISPAKKHANGFVQVKWHCNCSVTGLWICARWSFEKNSFIPQAVGEFGSIWNRVATRCICIVKCTILTIRDHSLVHFGTMWIGDAHELLDGKIISSLSISSTSVLATEILPRISVLGREVIG